MRRSHVSRNRLGSVPVPPGNLKSAKCGTIKCRHETNEPTLTAAGEEEEGMPSHAHQAEERAVARRLSWRRRRRRDYRREFEENAEQDERGKEKVGVMQRVPQTV